MGGEAHFFCEAPRANSATDPVIVPTKIFDNVYAIGNPDTVYVVETSDGLLMFDSLGAASWKRCSCLALRSSASIRPR